MTRSDPAGAPRAGGFLSRLRAARRSRRRELALSGLSDWLLRDIGFERDTSGLPDPILGPFV